MSDTTLAKGHDNGIATAEAARSVTLAPRVDILETEHELLVYADLPGVIQENLDIRFEKGELTIHGRRTGILPVNGIYAREVEAADYFRSFRISEQIDAEKIWAELKNGVLSLHLPKVEAAKPRKIAVKAG